MIKLIFNNFLLFCLLIISSIIYFLTFSTAGLQTDIKILTYFLPGQLKIEHATGKLFSSFTLQNIIYKNNSQDLHIQSIAISWDPRGILLKKIILHSVEVDHAIIFLKNLTASQDTSSQLDKKIFDYLAKIHIQQARLKQITFQLAGMQAELNGSIQKTWNLAWKVNIPELKKLAPEYNGSLITTGQVNGPILNPNVKSTLTGKNLRYANQRLDQLEVAVNIIGQPRASSSIKLSATNLTVNNNFFKKFYLTLTGNFIPGPTSLQINIHALINNFWPFSANLLLPKPLNLTNFNQQSINGNITTSCTQFKWLEKIIPQIKNPQGAFKAVVLLNGTLAKPDLRLKLNLLNGKTNIPFLGITPYAINLAGTADLTKKLNFAGNFRSGKGIAQLKGMLDYAAENYGLTLQVKGSQLQAIHLPDYEILLSPNVTLDLVKQNLQLKGDIFIPYAKITPQNFNSTVTLPSEIVFVDSNQTINLPFTTSLQLDVQLGPAIHLASHDLAADLSGKIQLIQLPNALINAVGELETTKGTYTAYGQTLVIQTGRLIYTGGSLMNPGLDIRAVKQLKTVNTGGNVSTFAGQTALNPVYTGTQTLTVGVEVLGSLEKPVFNLFSTPPLSQGDILSYLVFDVPQSQANGSQYGAILSALSALNPTTANMGNFTQNLQQKLGVSEIGIQSVQVFNPNATSNTNSVISTTSFVVGKQLTNDLSIHYSVGLFYPVSILNLRYQLTKNWAIQSETSTLDNGGDILYSIERD